MQFNELNLRPALLDAVRRQGYEVPTPIQQKAIPVVLAGSDMMGCAKTGTGKTAAFALPILDRLAAGTVPAGRKNVRCLVLTPTRELCAQVGESFEIFGAAVKMRTQTIFGGVSQIPQERTLRAGCDILVATPGRLLDLMGQRLANLASVEVFVLDEADRMLDMGFINDIRKIVEKLPPKRQNLMFSATMPEEIRRLAGTILNSPEFVAVDPPASTVDLIAQQLCFVERNDKIELLLELLEDPALERVLVFTRTKHGADRVEKRLSRAGLKAMAIHGNKSQGARTKAMDQFKSGGARVLVATDIAARGIDIDDITHVINFDLPNEPEVYVHRIGRTGRAGDSGIAIAFCALEERSLLTDIERMLGAHIPRIEGFKYGSTFPAPAPTNLSARGARPQAAPGTRDTKTVRHGSGNRGRGHWTFSSRARH